MEDLTHATIITTITPISDEFTMFHLSIKCKMLRYFVLESELDAFILNINLV